MSQPPPYAQEFPQQQSPYDQPPYFEPPVRTSNLAIAALIVSLAGFLFCALPTGLVGAIMGVAARSQIARSGGLERGQGLALAAILTGAAQLLLFILVVAFAVNGVRSAGGPGSLSDWASSSCRLAVRDSDVRIVIRGRYSGLGCKTAATQTHALSIEDKGPLPPNVACKLRYPSSDQTYEVRYDSDQELASALCDQLRREGFKG